MAGRGVLLAGLVAALALIAAALVPLSAAAPAPARGGLPASLKSAKEKDGPFKEVVRVNMPVGDMKVVWFRAKSSADKPQQFGFNDAESSSELEGYKVKWFKGDQNVSSSVQTEGQLLVLEPGDPKFLQAKVKRTGPGEPFCLIGQLFDKSLDKKNAYAGVNDECAT